LENTFVKRSLRSGECQENPRTGETHVPRLGRERLLNEAAGMVFIANNTTVPIPKLHACFEDVGAVYLIMEYVEGRGMEESENEQKLDVQEELESYLPQIHKFRSAIVGGFPGLLYPHIAFSKELLSTSGTLSQQRLINTFFVTTTFHNRT
jgi:hypothetical protein